MTYERVSLDEHRRRERQDVPEEPPPVEDENEYGAPSQTPAPIEEAATAGVRVPRQNSQGKIKLDIVDPITLQGKDVPERQWRVPGWIPDHAVTLDGGDAGFGKSTIKMQLAT
ncbi:MAG: AAA family ATPase, partial [Alphaproteobacteria bacterium]|nr:AAA family ATPase [Alphaproteobacteria bacterium]